MKYFSYDPYEGFEFHATEEAAKAAADKSLDFHKHEAPDEGWSEDVDQICWGEIKECVRLTECIHRPPDHELDADDHDTAGNDWSNSDWDRIEKHELLPPQ